MNALYSLYDALISINVPTDKARAVVDAMERDMTTVLASKGDLATAQLLTKQEVTGLGVAMTQEFASVRQEISAVRDFAKQEFAAVRQEIATVRDSAKQEFASVRQEIAALRDSNSKDREIDRNMMTVRLGSISVVCAGLLFAALKLT
jgi:hypothetical protein